MLEVLKMLVKENVLEKHISKSVKKRSVNKKLIIHQKKNQKTSVKNVPSYFILDKVKSLREKRF